MKDRFIHHEIQYIEFLSPDIRRIKEFYTHVFGWKFVDYGDRYSAFSGQYIDGGFASGKTIPGSMLVIIYSEALAVTLEDVARAGGKITKPIFSFPGGYRFEFEDPDGNRLAVWSTVNV